MGQDMEPVRRAGSAAARTAIARARATRKEAAAVSAEARQRRRLRTIVRRAKRLELELHAIHLDLELWDGVHPPLQRLIDQLETVEGGVEEIEARLQALRKQPAD